MQAEKPQAQVLNCKPLSLRDHHKDRVLLDQLLRYAEIMRYFLVPVVIQTLPYVASIYPKFPYRFPSSVPCHSPL